jgi:PTH2 family peptidyl-tRNA hydrolase
LSRTEEITMVLVTRADLKLSRGKLAAQCGHAVAECVLRARKVSPRTLDRYRRDGGRKIVCKAPDEDSLRRILGRAKSAGLVTYLVSDAGHTEIPAGTVTVVGIGPGPRSSIDAITGDLSLVN